MTPLILALALLISPAYAAEQITPDMGASVTLPIAATIVQCGRAEELIGACERDVRCCVLIEPDAGEQQEEVYE